DLDPLSRGLDRVRGEEPVLLRLRERLFDAPLDAVRMARGERHVVASEGVLAADLGAHQPGADDENPHRAIIVLSDRLWTGVARSSPEAARGSARRRRCCSPSAV